MKSMLFAVVTLVGLTTLSVALGSVPSRSQVTDDTAIYQRLSEIRVPRQKAINFDSDIKRLASLEGRYRENLPALSKGARLRTPMQRISQQKYRYSGARTRPSVAQ